MFNDYFLRSDTANGMVLALLEAGVLVRTEGEDGSDLSAVYGNTVDTIGKIMKETGNTVTHDGIESPELSAIPGWHVNLRCLDSLTEDQVAILPILDPPPLTPERVFA